MRNLAESVSKWSFANLTGPDELMFDENALVEHVQKTYSLDKEDPKLRLWTRKILLSGNPVKYIKISNLLTQKQNHITDIWFDIVLDSMARVNAADETLDIRYIGTGWLPTEPADGDSVLASEGYRFEVDILDRDGFSIHMGKFVDPSEGNAPSYTIVSIDDADTVTLSGPNQSFLLVGRRLRIYTGPNQNTDYTDVTITAANTITGVTSFTPALSPVPVTTYTANLLHAEFGFFSGSGASSSANTGKMINRLVADRNKITGGSAIYHCEFSLARG